MSAISVPWMVSPSVSEFLIRIVENADCHVELDVAVLPPIQPETAALLNKRAQVRFEAGQWVRTYPAFADIDTIDPDLFGSAVVRRKTAQVSIDEQLLGFRREWLRSARCPDPGFYEAEQSAWLAEVNAHRFGCRHYVLVGCDMWMEVLALGVSWSWAGQSTVNAISTDDFNGGI